MKKGGFWNFCANLSRIGMAGAAALAVLLMAGCPTDGGGNNLGIDTEGVDWTDYQTPGTFAIRIRNESNRDLVAFKNTLSAETLLGGIPKNANDHGIKKNAELFNSNTDFSIIFLTKEDYEDHKSDLARLEQRPFTRIFAMYNATGTNNVPFIVSGKLGGENRLVINNMTSFNMELREDSPRGTTIGYAPYEANNTTLYMNSGSIYWFPVFKKYNAVRDEILTIYPRAADGLPVGDTFSFQNGNILTINAANYQGNTNFSSGAAFLVIHNSSNRGIEVFNGVIKQVTPTGISAINPGEEFTYTILMDGAGGGRYESSKGFSGWKIVQLGNREKELSETTLDADYRYTLTVTGNWDLGVEGVTFSDYVKGTQKITDEVLGTN
jgi:hypothetical protein